MLNFTEWEEICNFDVNKYKQLMKHPIVLDGRNCYTLDQLKEQELHTVLLEEKQ